ncbi:MAG: ATP-binding protein [Myxococcales bacterium]
MTETILYVDDDESNLVVFQAACGRDFKIVTASSGAQALELMRKQQFALVIADQRMPGMTGVELLERTRTEWPDVVRILITAYSDFHDATAAINRGQVQRFLRKPWVIEELRANVAEALSVYRTSQRIKALELRLRETERVYALGVVAAGIAHELRNPITAVATNLSLMREEVAGLLQGLPSASPLSEALRQLTLLLADAREGVQRITDITRGVELSQRRRDTENHADFNDVIRLTLASLRGELRMRAEVRCELDPLPPVRGSRTKLGQVVLNLLVNALQSLPERPRVENNVDISLRKEGRQARLDVQDNGCGIAESDLEKVFDPFFTTKADGGTGLGLAISRRIVEEVGGVIHMTSEMGKGTRFSVYVPLADQT